MTDAIDIPADRNKTDLTHDVTEGAAKWLASIGAKCIETEVPVGPKWIADIAAFWSPTPTEATAKKLIPRAKTYPYGQTTAAVQAWHEHHDMRVAAYRALPQIITIIVEVKTTRADFKRETLAEGKFNRPRVADVHIMATPYSLIKMSECPSGWLDLIFTHYDECVPIQNMIVTESAINQKLKMVAAIAERRHNRTANAFFSALSKRRRSEDAELLRSR
jgi:hypothetical protein